MSTYANVRQKRRSLNRKNPAGMAHKEFGQPLPPDRNPAQVAKKKRRAAARASIRAVKATLEQQKQDQLRKQQKAAEKQAASEKQVAA